MASVKVDAPKGAAKDLVSRVFPRLAAHDVPDLVTVPALTHMLLDGAVAERYAVRYAHYFLQRVFEHHGRADLAASHPDARDAVAALTKCAKEGTGARQLLATRALVAAARAGVPEARDALDDAVAAPLATLSAGKHPGPPPPPSPPPPGAPPQSSPPPRPQGRTPPPAPPSARDSDCPLDRSTTAPPRPTAPRPPPPFEPSARARTPAPGRPPRLPPTARTSPRPPSPPPPRPRTSSSFATRGPPRFASRRTARRMTWRR